MKLLPIVVLISGRGSNLQAIIDAADPLVAIKAVISNRPEAKGLAYAQAANIETQIIDHKKFTDRVAFDKALQQCIDNYQPRLVVLAGFMRILTDAFVKHYQGRLLNIHPSLLPKFTGLNTHERALAEGVKEHGASVHFVTATLDSGPVILQAKVPVLPTDNATTLANRVLAVEHRIYPQVIHWFAEGRLQWQQGKVFLEGQIIK